MKPSADDQRVPQPSDPGPRGLTARRVRVAATTPAARSQRVQPQRPPINKPLSARAVRRQHSGECPGPWSWTELLRFDQSLEQLVRLVRSAEPSVDVRLLLKQARDSAGSIQAAGFPFAQLLDVRLRRILSRLSPDEVHQLLYRLNALAPDSELSGNGPASSDLSLLKNTLKRGLLVRIHAELAAGIEPWCRGVFSSADLVPTEEVARAWEGMIAIAGAYAALLHEPGFVVAEIHMRWRVAYGLLHLVLGRMADAERTRLFARLPTEALLAFQTAKVPQAFHAALAAQPGEISRSEQQSRQIGVEVAAELSQRFQQQLSRITDRLNDSASQQSASAPTALQLLLELQQLSQQVQAASGLDQTTLMDRIGSARSAAAVGCCRHLAKQPDRLTELSCRELRRLQDHFSAVKLTDLDGEIAAVLTERFHRSQIELESNLAAFLDAVSAADPVAAMSAAHGLAEQLSRFEDLAAPAALGAEAEIVSRGVSARDVLRRTLTGLNHPVEQLQTLARQLESPAMQLTRDVLQYGAASTRARSTQQSDAFYRSWLIFSELADAFDDVLVAQAADMIPMLERPERRRKFTRFPSEFQDVLRDKFGVTISPTG